MDRLTREITRPQPGDSPKSTWMQAWKEGRAFPVEDAEPPLPPVVEDACKRLEDDAAARVEAAAAHRREVTADVADHRAGRGIYAPPSKRPRRRGILQVMNLADACDHVHGLNANGNFVERAAVRRAVSWHRMKEDRDAIEARRIALNRQDRRRRIKAEILDRAALVGSLLVAFLAGWVAYGIFRP